MDLDEQRVNVEQFKIKKLIKKLYESKGAGTSMISLLIPPKKQITDITKMLTEELGKASNIKDRVNRQSVQTAMTSTKERLKLYTKTPPNGLVLFCGEILEEDGRTTKKILIDFEPFRPVNSSLYFCDNKFHVEELKCLLDTEPPFGFIIVDGSGALFASLQGNSREILHKFSVELPKKHGRGGQSSVRFARLRLEKRHNYLRKVCEVAVQVFIAQDKANVAGLVLAGSADFKTDLNNSQMFDPRLKAKVIRTVDVSYGGENGLNQAIELSQESLKSVKFVQEKKLISRFFEEIAMDTGKIIYGINDTMKALEAGAVETIMCYEQCPYMRIVVKNKENGKLNTLYLRPEEMNEAKYYIDADTQAELEPIEQEEFAEWLGENYQNFGAELQYITDKSSEGFQFVKGFTGIGGFLRYKFEVDFIDGVGNINADDDDDDFI